MTITGFTHGTSEDVPLQRFEVFTGTGRRRDWSDEEKDCVVAESYSGEMSVSALRVGMGCRARTIVYLASAVTIDRWAAISVSHKPR
ncbi:transposase [Rhizobium laguerreae]|uniref:transposase n=1 Tax=Rhizobium laguerreae TaxID=1076926 RepID=UPI001C91179E|nr:transposase [Rhizobium laguerreae]MBY3488074.1 transposase [Rhizobium laguerreae]